MGPVDSETLKTIKNKQKRQQLFAQLKHEHNKSRHKERQSRAREERENPELKEKRLAENVPDTIDSKRVFDETVNVDMEGEDNFDSYFKEGVEPKVLVTTNANAKRPAYEFAAMLVEIIPNTTFVKRQRKYTIKDMAEYCANRDYTDLIVVNEDKKVVNGLTFVHLPEGPTFYFSITSLIERKKITGHGQPTGHVPELVLNNFTTRLGQSVSRLFQSLFPHRPEFEGRQVVTLHNQRDYIFFRMHRYLFKNEEKVGLQELGPQFTLKLRRIQKGIRQDIEWEYKTELEKDKRKFYL